MNLKELAALWHKTSNGWNSQWSLGGTDYNTFSAFRNLLASEKPVSVLWRGGEEWRNKDPASEKNPYGSRLPDLMKDGTTYQGCVDWWFSFDDEGSAFLNIVVWNGELLDGERRDKRAEWIYQIREPDHAPIIKVLKTVMNKHLWTVAERQQERFEEEQRHLAIQRRVDNMIAVVQGQPL
jgi:hypothetical protein